MFSRRFIQFAVIATIATVLLPAASYAGKGGGTTCTPIPVRITIMPIEGSVLTADRDAAYINATDGVFANIGICDGTYDLRIRLSDSSRMVKFNLPTAIANTNVFGPFPKWAGGSAFESRPWWTVFNLLWGRMNRQSTFTTRAMVSFLNGPGDPATYDLRIQAPYTQATPDLPLRTDINTPHDTSFVMVEDILGNCRTVSDPALVTLDSWIVTVNPDSIGTLFNQGYQKTRYSHAGQYKVSFKLHIQALTCVPASLTP